MGVVDLPEPRIGPGSRLAPKPIKFVLNWGRRYSLWVFNFGLACCAIEFIATSMSRHDFIRLGVIPFAPGPRQADLMVVSGTVSDKMAPAVKRLYEQMPEPKYVISFGACSNCGGPYWDSYCVTKGVDQIIPVDVYVPGCPPRPEALLHGIIKLQEKIAGESLDARYSSPEAVLPPPEVEPKPPTPAIFRRPLVLPPLPEPEEIEAAEETTQSLLLPDVEGIEPEPESASVRTRELPAPATEAAPESRTLPQVPVVNEPVVDEPVVDEPVVDEPVVDAPAESVREAAAEETQRLPSAEEVAREAAAKTQRLPAVEEPPARPVPEEPSAPPAPEESLAPEEPSAPPVSKESLAPEEPPVPKESLVPEESLASVETAALRRVELIRPLPPAEEVRKVAEERQPRRRRGARLRKFAEPPPVDALDDPDIIPGLSDDD